MIDLIEVDKQIMHVESMGFVVTGIILPKDEEQSLVYYNRLLSHPESIGISFSSFLKKDEYRLKLLWINFAKGNPDGVEKT